MNFADTGTFLALYHRGDQHHEEAVRLWPILEPPVVTSNLVIGEVGNLLGQRVGYAATAKHIADIYSSPRIDVIQSMREDELQALAWMRRYADTQTKMSALPMVSPSPSCAAARFAPPSRSIATSAWRAST
jgi:predicted nucleic acid-binding protein